MFDFRRWASVAWTVKLPLLVASGFASWVGFGSLSRRDALVLAPIILLYTVPDLGSSVTAIDSIRSSTWKGFWTGLFAFFACDLGAGTFAVIAMIVELAIMMHEMKSSYWKEEVPRPEYRFLLFVLCLLAVSLPNELTNPSFNYLNPFC